MEKASTREIIKKSKLFGNIRYMTDKSQWPDYVVRLSRSAAEAGRDAIRRLHAAGIPAVFERDGKIIESYPDGHEEILPEANAKCSRVCACSQDRTVQERQL